MTQTIHSAAQIALRDAIIDARRANQLSQEDVAKRLKCHQSMIARIESGERRIDVIEFVAICRALRTSPQKILKLVENAVEPNRGL